MLNTSLSCAPEPAIEVIAENLSNPTGLVIKDNTLYFSQFGANKISKIEDIVSGTHETKAAPFVVYPNPTRDFLTVKDLSNGLYFLITKEGSYLRFIKS